MSNLPRSALCASKGEWGAGREGRGVELKDSLTEFKDSFTSIKDSFTEFKDSFTEFKDSFTSIKDSFTEFKDSFTEFKDSFTEFKDSFTSIKDSSASIKHSFTSIKDSSPIAHAQCPIQLLERLRPKRSYAAGFTAYLDFATSLREAAPTTPAPSSVPLRGSKLRVASRREAEMLKYYAVTASRRLYPEASPLIASLCLPSMPTGRSPTIVTR